jgi:hypothetical protein
MKHIFESASRLPKLPAREAFAENERAHFDYMMERITAGFGPTAEQVAGEPYGVPHFRAMAVSPSLAVQLSKLGYAVMSRQDQPSSFTQADHEMIDLVLPLDSGYWALLAGHTPAAIASGIRIDAIRALRDGREESLTADERQVIEFIRAVRDGTVSDTAWSSMRERIGSERGVVEFVYLICLLIFHHRFCWAVGAPEMQRDAFEQMLKEYENGTRPMPERYKAPRQAQDNA